MYSFNLKTECLNIKLTTKLIASKSFIKIAHDFIGMYLVKKHIYFVKYIEYNTENIYLIIIILLSIVKDIIQMKFFFKFQSVK
jgi:hypothetical protein